MFRHLKYFGVGLGIIVTLVSVMCGIVYLFSIIPFVCTATVIGLLAVFLMYTLGKEILD